MGEVGVGEEGGGGAGGGGKRIILHPSCIVFALFTRKLYVPSTG